ncbi:hypothetical protein FRC05_010819 [Tulasnella sp. 425]|nr:hypothetical protein FRC05_010819 [Tulasnella sp. 425]
MTSGIDELEALLAALRLSFLTSSSATSSPEALYQSIAVFRAALKPQGIVPNPSPTVAHLRKQDDGNHHDFVNVGEPSSATSTTCGDDDRIDLTKQMDFVHAELRQGTDHIRELIQSVQELRKEVQDLRSAVVAPKSLASTEDHPPPSTPIINVVENCATLAPVHQAQVEPAPSPYAAGASPSRPILSTPTCPQRIPEVAAGSSILSPIVSAPPFMRPSLRVAPQLVSGEAPMTSACNPYATEAMELPTLVHLRSGPPSPAPCPVAIPTPAQTLDTVPIHLPYCPRLSSPAPVPVNTSEAIPPASASPKPVLSDIKPKDCAPQTVPRRTNKKRVTQTIEHKTRATNDGGKMKAEEDKGSGNFVVAESLPKSPIIATAIRLFSTGKAGDLKFKANDEIAILDHPTTPVGWMYGEVVDSRRGIFPARYVREVSPSDVKDKLNNDHFSNNSEVIEPGSKSPVTVTAVDSYQSWNTRSNELSLSRGDTIHVIDSSDTPVGWMYGEITETRRGIFPGAHFKYVKDSLYISSAYQLGS